MPKLNLVNGKTFEWELTEEIEVKHYEDPTNYAYVVIEEFNTMPMSDYLSEQDNIILDIGGNVGLFAAHIAPYLKKLVIVEPTENHMNVQKLLIKKLQKKFKFEAFHEQAALHSYTGSVGFHLEGVNQTMNRVNVSGLGIEVPCITLYDLCKKHNLTHVDFCKIDIEGSEDLAITVETVRPVNQIIDKFSIELHPRTFEMMEKYENIFQEAGYKTKRVDFNTTIFAFK